MKMQRLANSRHDLLSTSTARGRTSSPEGPDKQDQTEKLRGDSYNHQADSVCNDTPIAENM